MFSKESAFLKAHEKLILGTLLLLVVLYGGDKYINYKSHQADIQASVSAKILEQQKAQNVDLKAQMDKDRADSQAAIASLTAANLRLQQGILALESDLKKQKQADQTLPMPDLLNRWKDLAGLTSNDLTVNNLGVQITDAGARKTTETLENVPVLQKELDNEKQIIDNKDSQITSMAKVVDDESNLITGLNSQIVDKEKDCNNQINKVKADARKSKFKIGIFSTIGGLILRSFLHF